jgi:hypothetical protein
MSDFPARVCLMLFPVQASAINRRKPQLLLLTANLLIELTSSFEPPIPSVWVSYSCVEGSAIVIHCVEERRK